MSCFPYLFLKNQTYISQSESCLEFGQIADVAPPLRYYSVYTVPKQCRHAPSDPAHEEAIGPEEEA